MEFNTQNPNPILKITIPFTKTPKKQKHFRNKTIFFRNILENFKNPTFSKTHIFILHSLHVPQFIFSYIFLLFFCFFEKCGKFQNPKTQFFIGIIYTFHNSYFLYIFEIFWRIFKHSTFYVVFCIRSIIHIFIIL